jgi:membrane-associated protease RseP (regulator of RpoE activity)
MTASTLHTNWLPSATAQMAAWFVLLSGAIIGIASLPAPGWRRTIPAQPDFFPGFTVAPPPLPAKGLIVTSLETGSPAEQSGIAVGDEVEAIDAHKVASLTAASDYLRHDPHATVRIRLLHNDGLRDVTLRRNGSVAHGA